MNNSILNEKNEQIKDDSKTNKTLDNKVNIEENYELIKKEAINSK